MAAATAQSEDQVTALIDTTRSQFEAQMEQLRPAHEAFLRLEGIVANFERVTGEPMAPAPTSTPRRRSRNGQSRPEEFLRLVKESGREGITVSEAAEKMDGMNPNYLYRIAKDQVKSNSIVKGDDKRYRAA